MPYKQKKKRAEYMKQYRQFRKSQMVTLKRAIREERFHDARMILDRKPNISFVKKPSQGKAEKKSKS